MKRKWTKEQDDFLLFIIHAGQTFEEARDDFNKMFKTKRTKSALVNRFYTIKKSVNAKESM